MGDERVVCISKKQDEKIRTEVYYCDLSGNHVPEERAAKKITKFYNMKGELIKSHMHMLTQFEREKEAD